jgi:hypothetical protein
MKVTSVIVFYDFNSYNSNLEVYRRSFQTQDNITMRGMKQNIRNRKQFYLQSSPNSDRVFVVKIAMS